MKRVKIVGLTLNKQFGILKAQSLNFSDLGDGLIFFKAGVGKGKTTSKTAFEMGTSDRKLPDATMYGNSYDVECQLTDGDNQLWTRSFKTEKGKPSTTLYMRDKNGKKVYNPVIDEQKATPAEYLKSLRTDLSFGSDKFLSERLKTQQDFIMKLYGNQLIGLGVIFDKKNPKYEGSIRHRMEEAIDDRATKHHERRRLNAFLESFKAEGLTEAALEKMTRIDIEALSTKITELETKKREIEDDVLKNNTDAGYATKVAELQAKAAVIINEIKDFNREQDVAEKDQNDKITKDNGLLSDATNAIIKLQMAGIVSAAKAKEIIDTLPGKSDTIKLDKVLFDEKGKILDDEKQPTELAPEMWGKINKIKALRKEAPTKGETRDAEAETSETVASIELKKTEIENGEKHNKLLDRFNAFITWREANELVLSLYSEYAQIFEKVDTYVGGLKIKFDAERDENDEIIGKGEIKVYYNGQHNPAFFGNPKSEDRLLISYSGTQKPVVAILLQIELLKRKKKALPYIWIEAPIDNATVTLLEDLHEKSGVTILTSVTGDFTQDNLKKGEVLIEDGEILMGIHTTPTVGEKIEAIAASLEQGKSGAHSNNGIDF